MGTLDVLMSDDMTIDGRCTGRCARLALLGRLLRLVAADYEEADAYYNNT